jgi:hypothetical protein
MEELAENSHCPVMAVGVEKTEKVKSGKRSP